jgi:IS5 family transposase
MLFDTVLTEDCIKINPVLQTIFQAIEKNIDLLNLIHKDLCKGLKNPKTGRQGSSAKQILGFTLIKFRENLSYERTRDFIADSISLRKLLEFGFHENIPQKKAFIEAVNRLSVDTIKQINEMIIKFAQKEGIEEGKKIRTDSTSVDSNIHYPTDNSLMCDLVRVISRQAERFLELHPQSQFFFPNRQRSLRKRSQSLSRTKTESKRKKLFAQMMKCVQEVMDLSQKMRKAEHGACKDFLYSEAIKILLEDYEKLGAQILSQCTRRVFEKEEVPAQEKLVSIFEVHADIIVRGKIAKPVEFGHKVLLVEGKSGLITDYEVLEGNPKDYEYLLEMMDRHNKIFERYPDLLSADRGFYDAEVEEACKQAGIEEVVIPKRGYKSEEREKHEKRPAFKKGQKFRNGVEGRISLLKRKYGMDRCLMKGEKGFELFIGLCVLAHNMTKLAQILCSPKKKIKTGTG